MEFYQELENIKLSLYEIGSLVIGEKKKVLEENKIDDPEITRLAFGLSTPDILGYCFSKIAYGEENIARLTGALEGFQVVSIGINDILSDNHIYKKGKLTVLGKYGRKYTENLLRKTLSLRNYCAEKLESFGLNGVKELAEEQYTNVLISDKLRNSWENIPTIEKAIEVTDLVAGNFGRYVGKIASPLTPLLKLENAGRNIANAIHTLEDMRDFLSGEDLNKKKITLPLACYFRSSGSEKEKRKFASNKTREYVLNQLKSADKNLSEFKSSSANFIRKNLKFMVNTMEQPSSYLLDGGESEEDEEDGWLLFWPAFWLPLWTAIWIILEHKR
jgi:hypothetical protein